MFEKEYYKSIIISNREIKPSPNGKFQNCWWWTGGVNSWGYGYYLGRYRMNRISMWVFKDFDLENKLQIRHLCHNKLCCNPNHLEPGTPKQNKEDDIKEGKSGHHEVKLDEESVRDIRTYFRNKEFTQKEMAEMYGVNISTIKSITSYKTWKHI